MEWSTKHWNFQGSEGGFFGNFSWLISNDSTSDDFKVIHPFKEAKKHQVVESEVFFIRGILCVQNQMFVYLNWDRFSYHFRIPTLAAHLSRSPGGPPTSPRR